MSKLNNDQLYAGQAAFLDASLPNIDMSLLDIGGIKALQGKGAPVKVLVLYGSLRKVSFSRLLAEEAARLLIALGAEVKFFDPRDLPMPDDGADDHPKVQELRDLSLWSEAHVWVSPERHGQITAVMKNQIDQLPLSMGGVRPTQGRTLALLQVSGGSQSFNTVNTMRLMGRWMRMLTIPNQSSVPQAWTQFDGSGRMIASPLYDRVVDVMEELMKLTLLNRPYTDYLLDRYSERKESPAEASKRLNLQADVLESQHERAAQ